MSEWAAASLGAPLFFKVKLMRLLVWLLRALVFVLLFGLAIRNSGQVELRFYFEQVWQTPLSLVVLVCFALGIVIGVSMTAVAQVRQGREILELKKRLGSGRVAGDGSR